MIDPELQLEHGDRAHLAAIVPMAGWKILQRVMRSEADRFIVALINADPAEPQQVLAKHLLAKSAAQFLTGLQNRVNEEVSQYVNAPKASDKPVDITDGLLDLGDIAQAFEGMPNLLEEIS